MLKNNDPIHIVADKIKWSVGKQMQPCGAATKIYVDRFDYLCYQLAYHEKAVYPFFPTVC